MDVLPTTSCTLCSPHTAPPQDTSRESENSRTIPFLRELFSWMTTSQPSAKDGYTLRLLTLSRNSRSTLSSSSTASTRTHTWTIHHGYRRLLSKCPLSCPPHTSVSRVYLIMGIQFLVPVSRRRSGSGGAKGCSPEAPGGRVPPGDPGRAHAGVGARIGNAWWGHNGTRGPPRQAACKRKTGAGRGSGGLEGRVEKGQRDRVVQPSYVNLEACDTYTHHSIIVSMKQVVAYPCSSPWVSTLTHPSSVSSPLLSPALPALSL